MIKRYISLLFGTFIFGLPVVFIVSLLIFIIPIYVFDMGYDLSLFIPNKLGLVKQVTPDDIIELRGGQTHTVFLQGGRYRIFSDQPLNRNTTISIISQDTDQHTNVIPIPRTPTTPENDVKTPEFFFEINSTGSFNITASLISGGPIPDNVSYSIVPNVENQNATVAIISTIIQFGLIIFCTRLVFRYLKKDELEELKTIQAKNRDQWDSFLDDRKKS